MRGEDVKPDEVVAAENNLSEESPESAISGEESRMPKLISPEYANHLYKLDCEYAAYKLALDDPDSPESKHKRKLEEMLGSLQD